MHNRKKSLGQHFLHDQNIIKKIINSVKPNIKDVFLEIGPGEGVLSTPLQNKVFELIIIEKDKDLIPILSKLLSVSLLNDPVNSFTSLNVRFVPNFTLKSFSFLSCKFQSITLFFTISIIQEL